MWADWHAKSEPQINVIGTPDLKSTKHDPLCRHEEHAEHLADARQTTRVDLADIYRLRLEQLLKHHPVMRMLARRDADPMFLQRAPDRGVSQYIIRSRRLLDKPSK